MRVIDSHLVREISAEIKINKNLLKRLMWSSLADASNDDWGQLEMFGLPTKDGTTAGILFIELSGSLYAASYEVGSIGNLGTGRVKPIICDFCKTWQPGSRAGSITFRPERRSMNSVRFLCCIDLMCSLHVRTMTASAKISRAQLREDISLDSRIQRLVDRLSTLIDRLGLQPIDFEDNTDQA